jgi:hypothetical protein
MALFSFISKKPKPQQVKSLVCTVVVKTHRTATDFSWNWQLAMPVKVSGQQAVHLDMLIRNFCTDNANGAKAGRNIQTLQILLPMYNPSHKCLSRIRDEAS